MQQADACCRFYASLIAAFTLVARSGGICSMPWAFFACSAAALLLAASHVGLGHVDQARGIISELLQLQPNSSIKRDAYGYVAYARKSDQDRFVAALREAGLPEE